MSTRRHYWIHGQDREAFLQDLVSQDLSGMQAGDLRWSALLTPQGRLVADFFLYAPDSQRWWLDVEARQADALLRQLTLYRLRRDVSIEPQAGQVVTLQNDKGDKSIKSVKGNEPSAAGKGNGTAKAIPDPRLQALGLRLYSESGALEGEPEQAYRQRRIQLGVPEGEDALPGGTAMLIESGFVELNGLSVTKGCYVGQEVTARIFYRALVKRRLVPVQASRDLRAGEPLLSKTGQQLGEVREAALDGWALALVRREALGDALVTDDGAEVVAKPPSWLRWNPREDTALD